MAKIVIFGAKELAQLAHFYLCREGLHEIVAFAVHQKYIAEDSFMKLGDQPSYAKLPDVRADEFDQDEQHSPRCF
jgi:hypothetical protein